MRSVSRVFPVVVVVWVFGSLACSLAPQAVPGGGGTAATTGSGGAATGGSTGTTSSVGGLGGQGGGTTSSTGSGTASITFTLTTSTTSGTAEDPDAAVTCDTVIGQHAVDPSPHIATCFPVTYATNPPTSGPHYPIWAAYKTYDTPVPRGFQVHDLEHGAVVVSYNCPSGCDAELADLEAFLKARPADPLCVLPVKARIVVTPDPLLDVRFAAAAWGWSLRSRCFDLPLLGAFLDAHYGHASEDTCADGTDVTDPASGVPADCGAPDAGGP